MSACSCQAHQADGMHACMPACFPCLPASQRAPASSLRSLDPDPPPPTHPDFSSTQAVWEGRAAPINYSMMVLGYSLYLGVGFNTAMGRPTGMRRVGLQGGGARVWGGRSAEQGHSWQRGRVTHRVAVRQRAHTCLRAGVRLATGVMPLMQFQPPLSPDLSPLFDPQAAIGLFIALTTACLSLAAFMAWAPEFGDYAPALAVTIAGAIYLLSSMSNQAALLARFIITPRAWARLWARCGAPAQERMSMGRSRPGDACSSRACFQDVVCWGCMRRCHTWLHQVKSRRSKPTARCTLHHQTSHAAQDPPLRRGASQRHLGSGARDRPAGHNQHPGQRLRGVCSTPPAALGGRTRQRGLRRAPARGRWQLAWGGAGGGPGGAGAAAGERSRAVCVQITQQRQSAPSLARRQRERRSGPGHSRRALARAAGTGARGSAK